MRKKKATTVTPQEQLSLFVDEALEHVEFLQTVHKVADGLEQETGVNWNVRLLPKGYTMKDRMRELMWEQAKGKTS